MSDEVTKMNKLSALKRFLFQKRVLLLVIAVLLVCSILSLFLFSEELNLDKVHRWFKYLTVRNDESYGTYSFDSHSSNCYESFGDGLAVAAISGLNIYDPKGEELFVVQQQFQLPQLQTCGEMAMVYDVGGHDLVALHRKKGEVLHLEETHPILDADLSDKGGICLSSSANGYKSVLSVYNNEQDLVYRWLSSSTYFPVCALAPNGKDMAAVAVGQSDGEFESKICFFKTNSEEILKEVTIGNELIYDMDFLKSDVIGIVGETTVHFVSTKGDKIGKYRYEDNYLKDFDFGGDGFLTLTTNMYRAGNRYSLVTVDNAGKEIANRYIGEEILDVSACGHYIAVLTPGKLTIYTKSLSVYSETDEMSDATAVVMREDGSAIVLGGGRGKLYIP